MPTTRKTSAPYEKECLFSQGKRLLEAPESSGRLTRTQIGRVRSSNIMQACIILVSNPGLLILTLQSKYRKCRNSASHVKKMDQDSKKKNPNLDDYVNILLGIQ